MPGANNQKRRSVGVFGQDEAVGWGGHENLSNKCVLLSM